MSIVNQRSMVLAAVLVVFCLMGGCGGAGDASKALAPAKDLGPTIGSLAAVVTPESVALEGYGLVGGLRGTGSVECPPPIRAYLVRYIPTQLSERGLEVDKLISSQDTAVVRLEAVMQTTWSKARHFDVRVTALPGTQTTSLEHGWLYRAELKARGTFGMATKVLADVEGPVFIDKINAGAAEKKVGYVLAGGQVLDEHKISLEMQAQNHRLTSRVRNRLNERFGHGTARAASSTRIELTVPAKYKGREQRFIGIVRATYLDQTPEITNERVMAFVRELAVAQDKQASEIALEAIGNEAVAKLTVLLSSSDEQVRFSAARCMLRLGGQRGLDVLSRMANDTDSAYRVQALQAIADAAGRAEAAGIARRLLVDPDFEVRFAAYEQLRELGDVGVTRRLIGRNFFLEQVAQGKEKVVFASRSGQPRIVLFGAPIVCRDGVFVQSADGDIIVSAPAGQGYVLLIRKHPRRPGATVQLRSSFDLADVIRTLCDEPLGKDEEAPRGLGVSYAEVMALLKQMCDRQAIQAEFRPGPLPKIG